MNCINFFIKYKEKIIKISLKKKKVEQKAYFYEIQAGFVSN